MKLPLLVLIGFVSFALAIPKIVLRDANLLCKDIVAVVDLLKLNQATPFCSSFLHIPTITVSTVKTALTTKIVSASTPTTSTTITTGTKYVDDYRSIC